MQHVIQIKNGIIKHGNVNVKIIISVKKVIVEILAHVHVPLKIVADTSVTNCDEIIIVMDIVSTKKTNAVATNVPSTSSIGSFISDHVNVDNYCYLLLLCKTKSNSVIISTT